MVTYLKIYHKCKNTNKMETLNQLTENQIQTTAEVEKEFVTPKTITSKSLKDWGYVEAGLNQGNPFAFENRLRWIKAGHVVDKSYDVNDELRRKRQLENEMLEKESQRNSKEKDQYHIKDVLIKDKENRVRQEKENIQQKEIQMVDGIIRSLFNPARFWLYLGLCSIISVYLIFFYASAMNAAFFRSMQQMVTNSSNGGDNDITLMLNSIFDANSIFKLSPNLLFVYLGAFLFFGFGTLPHIFHDDKKGQWIKITLATVVCLLIDGLIAYKIDSGIHELKIMMGIADNSWAWYKSVNFYLVMAFGFGTYMLWGFIYEAAIKEYEKKNVNAKAEIEIKGIRVIIRQLEEEIIIHKQEISDLQKQIDTLKQTIDNLKKDLERALTNPETLLRNIENFYAGWLQYLNATSDNEEIKTNCENIFKKYNQNITTDNPILN